MTSRARSDRAERLGDAPALDPPSSPAASDSERQPDGVTEALRCELVAYCGRTIGALRRWVEPEDLVQQVLVELRLQIESEGPPLDPDGLRAWLYQRVQWRTASVVRKHRRARGETELGDPCTLPAAEATQGSVTRADTRRLVRQLVEALPADYASVVRLCALEERSAAQTAVALGMTEGAVRKRYARARAMLARRLAAKGVR